MRRGDEPDDVHTVEDDLTDERQRVLARLQQRLRHRPRSKDFPRPVLRARVSAHVRVWVCAGLCVLRMAARADLVRQERLQEGRDQPRQSQHAKPWENHESSSGKEVAGFGVDAQVAKAADRSDLWPFDCTMRKTYP